MIQAIIQEEINSKFKIKYETLAPNKARASECETQTCAPLNVWVCVSLFSADIHLFVHPFACFVLESKEGYVIFMCWACGLLFVYFWCILCGVLGVVGGACFFFFIYVLHEYRWSEV